MRRRRDPTPAITRAARDHLLPGEEVVAGVHVQMPGTNGAAMSGAASGAVGATLDLPPSVGHSDDEGVQRWRSAAVAMGVDPEAARRMIWSALALTTSRLLVLRRSRLSRRVVGAGAAWPVGEVEIVVPRQGSTLTIHRRELSLPFELPTAHKFLPEVYRELPERLAEVRDRVGDGP
ncbi:MAG: hypothetical protein ACLFRV_12885 [Acidimicrobiales bacterium]